MLQRLLRRLIKVGRLTIIAPNGVPMRFGEVPPDEPNLDVVVRIRDSLTSLKLALHPDRYLGEAYMDGNLVLERGTLWDLLDLCGRNVARESAGRRNPYLATARSLLRRIQQYNPVDAARRNVAHHYDLSNVLYEQFLDSDLQYSCAYFPEPGLSIEDAQRAKKVHITKKLLLQPGQRVLDIGCGWGGLALSLAQTANVKVIGVTLSQSQFAVAQQRARMAALGDRITFELRDFRQVEGKFDRIVSVGMFEHVGTPHYAEFFDAVARLLTDDGIALIHSIGRKDGPSVTSAWIRKYIFPGAYIPALSEVLPAIERTGLWITDLEILRLHYAETLRRWRDRFLVNRRRLRELYDDRFCRMWEFYLAASEMSFRHMGMMVFQAQLSRRVDTVPLTRAYLYSGGRDRTDPASAARTAAPAEL
jgi:cyclopropane-fatty-acyl-phospholipid synthase